METLKTIFSFRPSLCFHNHRNNKNYNNYYWYQQQSQQQCNQLNITNNSIRNRKKSNDGDKNEAKTQKYRNISNFTRNQLSVYVYVIILLIISPINVIICNGFEPSGNDDAVYSEKGTYVGCFLEKIDVYKTSIFAGTVQMCLDMCESIYFRYAVLSLDKCACSNTIDYANKLEASICNTRCSRNKAQYCGGVDSQSYYDTGVRVSGPPKKVEVVSNTNTSITIRWDEPPQPAKVTTYVIKPIAIKSFANYPIFSQLEWVVQNTEKQFEMIDLHPGTRYNISVTAMCENEICGTQTVLGETDIGDPDPIPKEPEVIKRTDTQMIINIKPGYNNNGPISYYRLVVMFVDDTIIQQFDQELLAHYNQSVEDGIPYYITAEIEFQNGSLTFVVGDKKTYHGFYNAPLPPKSHVHILIGVVSIYNGLTKVRYSPSTHAQHGYEPPLLIADDNSVFALSTACIIFGVLLIASIITYCYLRLKTGNRLQRLTDSHELSLQGPMVEVENNGFVPDDHIKGNFKSHLNSIIDTMDSSQKYPRNALRLNIDDIIGCGQFGEVVTGSLYTNNVTYDCQIHVVSDDMNTQSQATFLHDLEQIIRLMPHEKFLIFHGISISPDWFYVIFERIPCYLKKRLVESRVPDSSRFSAVSEECVLQWIYDIATAMEYLEVNKTPHKTLCSYNVYVTQLNQVKLSLFGPTPYGDLGKSIDIQRWQAPEVVRFQHYSIKSDVWSFACLAWECCTLGATLYANVTSQELLPRIRNGVRPEQANFIYNDIYQIFLNCWQIDPKERPDFEEIAFNIRQLLLSPRHVLSFDRTENTIIPYYLPLLEVCQT